MQPRIRAALRRPTLALGLIALAAIVVVAAATAARQTSAAGNTLVVDKSFDLKTADPQRQYEPTGGIVDRALYDTLLKFKGADVAHPLPDVATSWTGVEGREDVHVHAAQGRRASPTGRRSRPPTSCSRSTGLST